ncbi:hypothetical protein CBM2634_B140099 [Cupriavidus taiwanensis]|uniref:Uncharacterized protein n=1 Tax=Cupriavidus taiwanensis TaxID=164546 RepID=A0A375J4S1_9BURK|nr:hypothetical protein CBM2634_B140099 [Cupriavidus taiwanensis]
MVFSLPSWMQWRRQAWQDKSRVRGLIRDSYADFGPTLAAVKRRGRYSIDSATRRRTPR